MAKTSPTRQVKKETKTTYGIWIFGRYKDCDSEGEVLDLLKRIGWSDFEPVYGIKRIYDERQLLEEYMIL